MRGAVPLFPHVPPWCACAQHCSVAQICSSADMDTESKFFGNILRDFFKSPVLVIFVYVTKIDPDPCGRAV